MKITDLLTTGTICLDVKSNSKTDVLNQAIDLMFKSGVLKNKEEYTKGIFNREKESTTGVGEGIAIPHCKSDVVTKPQLVAMVIPEGVDYESLDGEKVKLLFMIAAPNSKDNVHLDVLATLSTLLMDSEFSQSLINAKTKEEFLEIINKFETAKNSQKVDENKKQLPTLLAATACPTGIAHTYMAQEALEKAAKAKNITIKVETNGSGGQKNKLSEEEIQHAEAIIVAADAYIEMDRFNGKHVIVTGTSKAIKSPDELIDKAINKQCPVYNSGSKSNSNKSKEFKTEKGGKFHTFYRHLMSGISHMIPFIVAGGLLLAIAYIIDLCAGVQPGIKFGNTTIGAQIFHMLGADLALGLMMPIVGGFIAYSIAGKPGLVSGFVGAFAATKGQFNLLYFILLGTGAFPDIKDMLAANSSGFLGAIIAGFAAGYLVLLMKNKWFNKMPRTFEGVRDIILIPLISTFLIGVFMLIANIPLSFFNIGIALGLQNLNKLGLTFLVGFLVAALMATDMGGPINKAAHYFAIGLLTTELGKTPQDPEMLRIAEQLMAANIVGIIVPPVGISFATWLFPRKFSKEDRKPSPANLITGCFGITEGAIPYAAKDPVRIISSCMVGAGIGGLISTMWGGVCIAPEGGIISMLIMGKDFYKVLIPMIVGSLITAIMLGCIKKDLPLSQTKLRGWKGIPIGLKSPENKKHTLDIKLANAKPEFNQILFDDYVEIIEALKKDWDDKLADKKQKVSKEKYEIFAKKVEAKKAKLDVKINNKKEQLIKKAKLREKGFDINKFNELEAKIIAKKKLIDDKEAKRIAKVQTKKALKLKKKQEKELIRINKQKSKQQVAA